jgi:hypothetical protein
MAVPGSPSGGFDHVLGMGPRQGRDGPNGGRGVGMQTITVQNAALGIESLYF